MIDNSFSITPSDGSVTMLGGEREGFSGESKAIIRLSKVPDFESEAFRETMLPKLIKYHKEKILPRYNVLNRYYNKKNDILYRSRKSGFNVVDNRIASAKARNAVTFGVGYMYNKPVTFNNENYECEAMIERFMKETNAHQYFSDMEQQQLIYGTGYGLISMDQDVTSAEVEEVEPGLETGEPVTYIRQTLDVLDTRNTFVVYDYSLRPQSLFAVTYNVIDDTAFDDEAEPYTIANVYTPDFDYTYSDEDGEFSIVDSNENPYGAVRVTQWDNDPDRNGVFELGLDQIDAYDLSQSELANFQQISNGPLLLIKNAQYAGNTIVYKKDCDGNPTNEVDLAATQKMKYEIERQMMDANILAITDTVIPNRDADGQQTVLESDASYLVPVYDATGTETYKQRLERDLFDATMQPNITDESFSGNLSGVALEYKLIATDTRVHMQQSQRRKSMMRELRLAFVVWSLTENPTFTINDLNETEIVFTTGNPGTLERQKDMISALKGIVSDETMAEMLTPITQVQSTDEIFRQRNTFEDGDIRDTRKNEQSEREETQGVNDAPIDAEEEKKTEEK